MSRVHFFARKAQAHENFLQSFVEQVHQRVGMRERTERTFDVQQIVPAAPDLRTPRLQRLHQ
jgi:hypothetical protein